MEKIKLVDSYLKENFDKIQAKRETSGFSWQEVTKDIISKNAQIETLDSEYVRSRFSKLRKRKEKSGIFTTIKNNIDSTIKGAFSYISGNENKEQGTKEFTFTADDIPTDQEIIEHFKIDTKKYRINQIYHKTSFSGKYAITVSLLSIKPEHAVDYQKLFKEFIDTYQLKLLSSPASPIPTSNEPKTTSVLLNLSDLHVGKLAWDKEVGADFNVDIAKEVFMNSLKNLAIQATRCFSVEEFILNIGGDFLHTNGSNNQTANGTIMNDVDTRYQKIYMRGLEILTEAVDYLSSFKGVKVKLFIVQGNHDKATSFYLGESLKAFYRKDKDVEIVNDPHIRKYHKYGVTSYMLTHGDCKDDGLPLTFAVEKPDYFSSSLYRYIYLGHLHKTSKKVFLTENEVGGVVLRRLNSLSVMDAWHNENNYYGAKRMANAIIFHKEEGQIAEFNYIVKK